MINVHPLDNTSYQQFRYDLILSTEQAIPTAYLDTNSIPTIGIGFNLRDDNILSLVLSTFGIDVPTYLQIFHDIVKLNYADNTALQTALNTEMNSLAGLNPPQANRSSFAFSSGSTRT